MLPLRRYRYYRNRHRHVAATVTVVAVAVITASVTAAVTLTAGGPYRVGDACAHRVRAVGRQRRREACTVARLSVPAVRAYL